MCDLRQAWHFPTLSPQPAHSVPLRDSQAFDGSLPSHFCHAACGFLVSLRSLSLVPYSFQFVAQSFAIRQALDRPGLPWYWGQQWELQLMVIES